MTNELELDDFKGKIEEVVGRSHDEYGNYFYLKTRFSQYTPHKDNPNFLSNSHSSHITEEQMRKVLACAVALDEGGSCVVRKPKEKH